MATIPPELQPIIAQAKRQMPELAAMPDEVVAMLILQAMQEQQGPSTSDESLEGMSSDDLLDKAEPLMNRGQWDLAEKYLLQGLESAEKEGNSKNQIDGLSLLGRLCRYRGDFRQAMVLYQRALALAERAGERRLMGMVCNGMGTTYCMQGNYLQAIEYYEKSRKDRLYDDESDLAADYSGLGIVYTQQGDFEQAIHAYKKAIQLNIKTGRERGVGKDYGNLGTVYKEQGQYDLAIEMHQKSLEIAFRIGDQQTAANAYKNIGNVHDLLGNYGQAIQMYRKSLEINQRIGSDPSLAGDNGSLARVYQKIGNTGKALAHYDQALRIFERIGDRQGAALTYFNLGNLYRDLGEVQQAHAHYQKAKALFETLGVAPLAQRAAQALRQL